MLTYPSLEKLKTMKLNGMARALEDQIEMRNVEELSFEERLGLLIDREYDDRMNRSLRRRLQVAKLRYQACLEDLDFSKARGLDKALILRLGEGQWIKKHHNILVTGATGVGKSFLACAFGHRACMEGYRVAYFRLPRLLRELQVAKGDGRYPKLLEKWAKMDLLILDDWGLTPLSAEHCRDLLEILEDRHQKGATLVTSQVPMELWHKTMKSATLADAILDRMFHQAYRIALKGDSKRKTKPE